MIYILALSALFAISYGQTWSPTPAPTSCVCLSYETYSGYNGTDSLVNSAGDGCVTDACYDCDYTDGVCTCYDEDTNVWCAFGNDLADAIAAGLGTVIIVLIVIGSVCGLCILICIAYCVCAGALCCAAASNANKGGTGGTQMV
eukprot:CAMPEP_0201583878 /NCGR_PEP_ID=MMETSP0190_2-20130828/104055_1 /ASSEMBLY_ACC=CAM_ASM_000263 /TAXON_ID=37353 /ORGANISM="Rosalina sp." /LENGTH=143 /DNA_ID=CAMNT_0048026719 /DNA_START=58 /DNA_END=489 /DNA_ORIENTATION=+